MSVSRGTIAIAAAVLLAVVVARYQGVLRERAGQYEADVRSRLEQTEVERARADSLEAIADSAEGRLKILTQQANSLKFQRLNLNARIDTVRVPAEAIPYTAPRDTLIAILSAENDTLRSALLYAGQAITSLRQANTILRASNDSLVAVLERRPKPKAWWIPDLTVGVSAGVATDLRLFAGPAVQLGWKIKL